MIMRHICFLIIIFSLSACSKEEVKKEFYKNGQLKEVTTYKGHQLYGPYEAFYENGQIRAKGSYEEGKMVGTWKYWYENGLQMSEGTYKGNQLVNLQAWDKEGNQTIKDCTGIAILYYPDGSPMSQVSYKDCLMHGEWITWFEGGQEESRIYYERGIPTGVWRFWNPDGTLQKAEKHSGGMEH